MVTENLLQSLEFLHNRITQSEFLFLAELLVSGVAVPNPSYLESSYP
jgi:hypothetical protein